jgi:Rod binding domain-containing protein
MSAISGAAAAAAAAALPPINEALLPASIRNGSPAAKSAYQTALGFEDVLVNQLSQAMMSTVSSSSGDDSSDGSSSDDGSSDSAGSDPAATEYSQLLPQALTSGIMSAGGLGIAQQIATALDPAIASDPSTGGPGQPSGGATASSGASR